MPDISSVKASSVMGTYNRFPLSIQRGKGTFVWDTEGKKYLDFTSGIAVCNLGHAPQYVQSKISEQLETLWHCSNLYTIPVQEELAAHLTKRSSADKVFFCNSGAEANEAAIKLARKYANDIKGVQNPVIVTFKQSFHGRTLAALSATGQSKIQKGFAPLLTGFRLLPFNDTGALQELNHDGKTCAVLLEMVQGEGGVIPADPLWIQELARSCKEQGILLMVDEVQTGAGRTGSMFAYEHYGISPDVITMAKGLGSGFPIGAMLAKDEAAKAFEAGSHGSTFGGNPLACTAGLATLQYIEENNLLEHAAEMSSYLQQQLQACLSNAGVHAEIRGKGLLLGIVIEEKAAKIAAEALKHEVLLLTAGPDVVRLLPPLNVSREEIDEFILRFKGILDTALYS
ncbi:acetylornithine transaminase [Bacillus lacus]|uniref:Acetylornithine aminotransferase n=1 Tax=Metabacillus lacus TaxID=1983721 RepID=A0A7X2IZ45_9BACI|nr:acetylornithine transaminase [Metabacillus lacus]MRX72468.1 acetylornithine transaminase [Metabacillus lacus]